MAFHAGKQGHRDSRCWPQRDFANRIPPFFLTLANALLERLFSCAKGGDLFSLGRALTVNSAPTLVAMSYIGTTSVSWTKATSGDRYLCAVSHIGDYDLVGLDLSRVDETIFGPEGQY
jgi:hypothetical protein